MSNSIDYTTISIQPQHASSKQLPICTNQGGGLILGPSETLDHQYHQSNRQLTRDKSDQDISESTTATKTNNAPPLASDASWSRHVYRECQKNHAASIGRYVVDGCGEFMASGEEGTAQALKCAACQCHRSFHRRDIEDADCSQQLIVLANNQYNYPQHPSRNEINTGTRGSGKTQFYQPSMLPTHHHGSHRGPGIMAFHGPKDSSSKDLNMFRVNVKGREKTMTDKAPSSKKRFRTKFSREQKVRMQQLAEELGWKIHRNEDEEQVEQLCHELGVKRSVFKVWMHNNKQKQTP
ncbi:hypothetical protein DCAR_0519777 [Daucus carota subsp. sativus]|uniref:ZF-HD dimerization-type domain-containing protein n=1 Tax=Daucus carota subsp. sativus TaxID=79200 RepID=A0AAF0X4I0_DAUCS|nr:PREDICTED: zinc-finger homeodomain protein 6-like [Daucus carota subsp. sativus]XP_017252275.1 PREDICTED: zinc-finger homeodomain protein 6-like [Daucus carota subsp. sativus]WOH00417.1 hypothetical protein DCAR_0519777 [Daucus carota subsp. sativus]